MGKRGRTRANTKTLGFVVATFKFVQAFLRRFIVDAGLANVPAMVRLLMMIAKLGSKTADDFPNRGSCPAVRVLSEVRVLSAYCVCFVPALVGKDLDGVQLSVTGHLENFSTPAHLVVAIFRKNGTRLVPRRTTRTYSAGSALSNGASARHSSPASRSTTSSSTRPTCSSSNSASLASS